MEKEIDFEDIKLKASKFSNFLVENEIEFTHKADGFGDGVAVYFNIKDSNGKVITFYFKDNGYVGVEVKEDE